MYHMADLILNYWKEHHLLEYLRFNVELVFIPLANPYGFNVQDSGNSWGRQNSNGVDLNRNFELGWTIGTVGTKTYGGPSPFSEVETQYVKQMIDNNKDAIYFCDFHTNGSSGNDYDNLYWHTINIEKHLYNENVDIAKMYFIEKMTRETIKEHGTPEDLGNYGWISYSRSQGLARDYGNLVIGAASTFEGFKKYPFESDSYTNLNIKANTEYIINWMITLLNQFKSNIRNI